MAEDDSRPIPEQIPEYDSLDEYGQETQEDYGQQPPLLSQDSPAALYKSLLKELDYAREQKLLDMIDHGFQPISFEDNLLTLGYSFNDVDADDVRQLLEARNNVILQMTFRKICPNGKILLRRLTEDGLEDTDQGKSQRHATEEERKALAERPAIRQLQEALKIEVIDARIKQ